MATRNPRRMRPTREATPLLPSTTKEVVREEAGIAYGAAGTHERSGFSEGRPWASSIWRGLERLPLLPNRPLLTTMTIVSLVLVFVLTTYGRLYVAGSAPELAGERTIPAPTEIQNLWGAYTPYFPVSLYKSPPRECKINQVNIIQRHGARFPTSGATDRILKALKKIQSSSPVSDDKLLFVKDYQYTLGIADLLPFGAYQSAESGALVYDRYRKLVSKGNLPFVRASGSDRVIDSATNWTTGFAAASSNVYQPKLSVILNENLNDTLEDAMCPNAGEPDEQVAIWTDIFATPVASRLNALAPGANLLPADIVSLMSLCAFESIALEKMSSWCEVFSSKEFAQYEYSSDVEKYYNRGYGQPLGPVQGVGYINELLARLTGQAVQDHTQTNHTLSSSPATFPLDRNIYADFSHDNLMIAVYSAMGLFMQSDHLDPTNPNPQSTWVTSKLTPFSGRLVVERLQCSGQPSRRRRVANRREADADVWKGTFVRVLVNDAVQPLEFCRADKHGLCTLDAFVESQAYARHDGEGDFEKCYQGL